MGNLDIDGSELEDVTVAGSSVTVRGRWSRQARGRTAADVRNAGGEWVDEEVVDDGLITSHNPDDLEAFCERLLEEFGATNR